MIEQPIPVPQGPPIPDSSDPEPTFDAQWEAFNLWVRDELRPKANALASATFANATDAASSANAAESSKTQAASSASSAASSASQAALSKSAAASSASQAASSANAAESSKTQAASSANAAAASASQAAATVVNATVAATASAAASAQAAAADAERAEAAAESISAGPVTTVNGKGGVVVLPVTITVAYANRAQLRTNTKDTHALVDGLGLFENTLGSTEPDDDESCFATSTGRWLLQAAHWDLIDAWLLPEVEERDAYTGTAVCSITSVAATSSAGFTGSLIGAQVGDCVIATPPAQLGNDAASTGRLSYHAFVSSANVITIVLTNASAAAATTNPEIRTAWPVAIIKP